jgi:hypothetical protein
LACYGSGASNSRTLMEEINAGSDP